MLKTPWPAAPPRNPHWHRWPRRSPPRVKDFTTRPGSLEARHAADLEERQTLLSWHLEVLCRAPRPYPRTCAPCAAVPKAMRFGPSASSELRLTNRRRAGRTLAYLQARSALFAGVGVGAESPVRRPARPKRPRSRPPRRICNFPTRFPVSRNNGRPRSAAASAFDISPRRRKPEAAVPRHSNWSARVRLALTASINWPTSLASTLPRIADIMTLAVRRHACPWPVDWNIVGIARIRPRSARLAPSSPRSTWTEARM